VIEEGGEDWSRCFIQLFHSSRQHLEEGVEVFRRIEDSANVALLSCNLAKLYRVQARALAPAEKKEVSLAEWKCYSKVSFDFFVILFLFLYSNLVVKCLIIFPL